MFQDNPIGTTMYCTHENKNEAGICPACMGIHASELVDSPLFGEMIINMLMSALVGILLAILCKL